ncbi:MAG: prolipoprotein diacylglyceryl transferase [Pseudomonadota bacterium]|nr:prolipoprotein diacylglyceryl transferase [Pseudomonadota bacterium]
MFTYNEIDPIAFQIGPLAVRWYGLMYVIGILGGWWLGRMHARKSWVKIDQQQVDDMVTWIALGIILGGRVGSVLFYSFGDFLDRPIMLFEIWKGGMSFHGGLIGVLVALWWFGKRNKLTFFQLTDFVAPLVPLGLGTGRIGNFINGELWGKQTDVSWAVVVDGIPRHASQLYEASLEGCLLFIVLWIFGSKQRPYMALSGLFLFIYGLVRFAVEFVRLPDQHIGYIAWNWLTQGQILTLPMIFGGIVILFIAYRQKSEKL